MNTNFNEEKIFHSKVFSIDKDGQKNINNNNIALWNRCWIWKFLLMTGIYNKKYSSRFTYFLIKLLPFIFLHFRAAFSIFLLSRSGTFTKSSVAAITMNICSIFAWHCMNFPEKYFRQFYVHIKKIQKRNIKYQLAENRKTNIRLLIAFLVPFIFSGSMIKAYSYERSEKYAEFWLFGNNVRENSELELALMFISAVIYFSVFLNSSILLVT